MLIMERTTPLSAKVIANCLEMHSWEQGDLAQKSGIARPTVSHHINGLRPIRDDHLAAYSQVIDRTEQSALIAAWMRDTLSPEVIQNVLDSTTNRIGEEARAWRPGLDQDLASMMDWLANELPKDAEASDIFRSLVRRFGYTNNSKPMAEH